MLLFVYGMLKKGFGLNRLLKNSIYKGVGVLEGYGLYVSSLCPFAVKEEGDKVIGEVYEIDEKTLSVLDLFEVGYIRRLENIRMGDTSVIAFVYVKIMKGGKKVITGIYK